MPIKEKAPVKKYEFQEFPKMVYGPNGEHEVIANEDDRPEGYLDHPDQFRDVNEADVKAAEAKAKEAAEAERQAIKQFLDEHKVDYHPNLGLPKLRELSEHLRAHLEAQGGNGA